MENMIAVDHSSNVDKIGYAEGTRILTVIFKDGSTYCYFEVPQNVYQDFLKSPSKGSFLFKVLRKYEYVRQEINIVT